MWLSGVLISFLGVHVPVASYSLQQLSYIQFPTDVSNGLPQFDGLNLQAAIDGAFDSNNQVLYVIGNHLLHLIDISDPQQTTILLTKVFASTGGFLTSIDVCGTELAISFDTKQDVEPGQVLFYHTYTASTNASDLTLMRNVTVGVHPDNIQYSRDCSLLTVPNKGGAGKDASGVYLDPKGTVSIIKTHRTVNTSSQTTVDFAQFDYGNPKYNPAIRVPSMSIPSSMLQSLTRLSQDVEPEYLTLSPDMETAWVTLPENNAIATLNISDGSVRDITPLPFKDWSTSPIDASDEDGGVHLRLYSNLLAMRQPSVIKAVSMGKKTYLFTADEGAIKAYTIAQHGFDWTDATVGGKLVIDRNNPELKANAGNIERLGRLQVSRIEGKNFFNDEYRHLVAFGGRGFSVWDSSDLTYPVFDSEGSLEALMESSYKSVFNSDYVSTKDTFDSPENLRDAVSEKLGAQVTALDVADDTSETFLVVGTSSTGSLYLYTIDKSQGQPMPRFQHIYRSGRTDLPWRDLYNNATAGDLYIRDIGIIPSMQNSIQKPIVYVISSGSGSLSLYEITQN